MPVYGILATISAPAPEAWKSRRHYIRPLCDFPSFLLVQPGARGRHLEHKVVYSASRNKTINNACLPHCVPGIELSAVLHHADSLTWRESSLQTTPSETPSNQREHHARERKQTQLFTPSVLNSFNPITSYILPLPWPQPPPTANLGLQCTAHLDTTRDPELRPAPNRCLAEMQHNR